jgi:hypothetical protein
VFSDFVVVWEVNNYYGTGPDGSYMGVFGHRFDATGTSLGSEFQVSVYTYGYQETPSVARAGDGFVVVWSSDPEDGDNNGVFGRRFNAGGGAIGSEFQVNLFTADRQWHPAVDCDAVASCLVVWRNEFGLTQGIYGRVQPPPIQ